MTQTDKAKADIVIVDDEVENLKLLREILSDCGYNIRPAPNGKVALKGVKTKRPDIILSDVRMPEMDGYEFCEALKSDKRTADIPVIFLTAFDDLEDKVKGFAVGGADYIIKPIQKEEMLARVRLHLNLKKSGDSLKTAAREKEEANAVLKSIFQAIPDMVVTLDKKLRVVNCNRELNDICGLTKCGKNFQDELSGGKAPCAQVAFQTLKTGKPVRERQIKCCCGENSERTVILNSTPLTINDQETSGVVMTMRDVTRLQNLERRLHERQKFHGIVGKSDQMQEIYSLLERISDVDITALITGASGTGKELIAETLHYGSNRSSGPLVKVNCAALPENLLESELFGHVKGAFTGAIKDRVGRFQAAEGGTIFLDEIGDIPVATQLRLLRVLESGEYEKLGDSKTFKADARIVAATNADLEEKISDGTFREDLYYRLKGVTIHLPPLKERKEDIPLLRDHFFRLFQESHNKNIEGLSEEVKALFMNHSWRGNARELKQTLEYAFAICPGGWIFPEHLPSELRVLPPDRQDSSDAKPPSITQSPAINKLDRENLINALNINKWNKTKTAESLDIGRRTLYRYMKKFNVLAE